MLRKILSRLIIFALSSSSTLISCQTSQTRHMTSWNGGRRDKTLPQTCVPPPVRANTHLTCERRTEGIKTGAECYLPQCSLPLTHHFVNKWHAEALTAVCIRLPARRSGCNVGRSYVHIWRGYALSRHHVGMSCRPVSLNRGSTDHWRSTSSLQESLYFHDGKKNTRKML